MDFERMLEKCRKEQWRLTDLDWDRAPKALDEPSERAVVQYFTNMAGIEKLAGALFDEQRRLTDDPTLKKIFSTFVADEERHSKAAERLAAFYDVHHYQRYEMNPHLVRFAPHFVAAIRHLSAEIANIYITCGEIILDVALLRSIDDYVDDRMSHDAMQLINRDESRHIAIDLHMCGYYGSSEAIRKAEELPPKPLMKRAEAWWALGNMLFYARPFFKKVFFEPMELTDPSGKRIREAFKRIQLISTRNQVRDRPFIKFMRTLQDGYNRPIVRALFGRPLVRILGVDPQVLEWFYTEAERERAVRITWDQMTEEVLAAKHLA